jgi:hypothetical protein
LEKAGRVSGGRVYIYQTMADTQLPTSQRLAPETVCGKVGAGGHNHAPGIFHCACLHAGGGDGRPCAAGRLLRGLPENPRHSSEIGHRRPIQPRIPANRIRKFIMYQLQIKVSHHAVL